LTPLEIDYLTSVMKKNSVQDKNKETKELDDIYEKARKTLKFHMRTLLLRKNFYHIDNQYKLAKNEKQTAENVVKLLTRCTKMQEA